VTRTRSHLGTEGIEGQSIAVRGLEQSASVFDEGDLRMALHCFARPAPETRPIPSSLRGGRDGEELDVLSMGAPGGTARPTVDPGRPDSIDESTGKLGVAGQDDVPQLGIGHDWNHECHSM
jgi:hypothetical protein